MGFKKPKFWDTEKLSLWSILLLPFSVIYFFMTWLRKISSNFQTHRKNKPIICVGNIYVGGTGKTPLAVEIFKFLKSIGKKPSFIKKYYSFVIDEIRMLKEIGETFDARNRKVAINLSENKGYDVAILDDGFQDFSIKPNFSILCFNSKQLVGNGFLIPAGPLRETLKSILRADCIMINGQKTPETIKFEQKIKEKFKNKKINFFYSKYKIKNIEKFRDKEIAAFAGIGNPSNFFNLLKENNLNLKKTFSFPDHHNYSQQDFNKITEDHNFMIVTTKKDYYRINEDQKKNCDFIDVNLEIENKENFEDLIKRNL